MNLNTYRRMIDNTMSYKDLREIDQVEMNRYIRQDGHRLYLFDPVRHELSAEPILLWQFPRNDDNIYRIKEDDSIVDCVAYLIEADKYGFYTADAYNHGMFGPMRYLDFLSHKDFMGVYYKGNSGITYATSINTLLDQVPSHLYLKYKHKETNNWR